MVLREAIKAVLLEKSTVSKSMLQKAILDVAGDLLRVGHGKGSELRLQPVNSSRKVEEAEVRAILRLVGHPVNSVAVPGSPDARSSKFLTYWTTTGVPVVVGGGENKGQKFERELAQQGLDSSEAKTLVAAIGVKDVVSFSQGSTNARRPLTMSPTYVGDKIADIIIDTKDGQKVYVSLKDPNGSTLGNFGIVGSFVAAEDGTVVARKHNSDNVLSALGVDKSRIVDGLNNKLAAEQVDDAPVYDVSAVKGIIESGYGYGYWYARKTSKGWYVVDLTTSDKLADYVGDVRVDRVKYPGANSKQCSVWLSTSTGKRFKVEIRNTKGGLIPGEIKFKVL